MNSLEELNGFGQSSIVFVDPQATPTFGTFVDDGLPATGVFVTEDVSYSLNAGGYGGNFVGAQGLDNSTNDWIQLVLDFSAAFDPLITLPSAARNIVYSYSGSNKIVTCDYIQSNFDLRRIIENTSVIFKDQDVNFQYSITVKWDQSVVPQPNIKQQLFNATITAVNETNLNGLNLTASGPTEHVLFDPSLSPTPAITDLAPNSNYQLSFTSTAGATLATAQGNTPATNIVLTGDKLTVNAAMAEIYYSPIIGYFNQTDVINYTLTVTNGPSGSYVSETGSFNYYVPQMAELTGPVNRSISTSIEQDLFVSPYPNVIDNLGVSNLVLTLVSSSGEIKESSGTGTWGSILTLTGTEAQLDAALTSVRYRPAIVLGTNTDTISYTLTWTTFTLDTGSWEVETTIDTQLNNLNGISINSTDIYEYDLFTGVSPQPAVTGTDTNTNYRLNLTYNSSIGKIDSNVGSVFYTGSLSTITTNLQAATFLPGDQDTTASVSYELLLENVSVITGSFSITNPVFFELVNWPSSITAPDSNQFTLFNALNTSIVDNTGGAEVVEFTFTITGGTLMADITDPTDPSKYSNTFTFSKTCAALNTDVIDALLVEPPNVIPGQTDSIYYQLSYAPLGQIYASGTIDLVIPAELELENANVTRSYIANYPDNYIFDTQTPVLIDRVDPSRTYSLSFTCAVNPALANKTDVFPYNNNTLTYSGTPAQINAAMSNYANSIKFIPDASTDQNETITWELRDSLNVLKLSGSFVIDGEYSATPFAWEGLHTVNAIGSQNITINESMKMYGQFETLVSSSSGNGGAVESNYGSFSPTNTPIEFAFGGGGGDGGWVKAENQPFDDITEIQPNDLVTLFNNSVSSGLKHYDTSASLEWAMVTVPAGGDGGIGKSSNTETDGIDGHGGGGGGAYSIRNTGSVSYTNYIGTGGTGLASSWNTNSRTYFRNTGSTVTGFTTITSSTEASGTDGILSGSIAPRADGGGSGGSVTGVISNITGSGVVYGANGGTGAVWDRPDGTNDWFYTPETDGEDAITLLRIRQR